MSTIAPVFHGRYSRRGLAGWLRTLALEISLFFGAALSDMSLLEHLEELRRRLIKGVIAIAAAMVVSWTFAVPLIQFLQQPAARVPGIKIIVVDATEIFSLYFKASFLGAIVLAAPVILWQVWQFIAPGLYKHEKRYAAPFLLSTTISFVAGAIFAYTVLLPLTLKLMVVMAKQIDIVEVTMQSLSYFGFLSMMILSMGIVFEIPAVIFILSRIGLVDARFLLRNLKYAVLLSCVAAALITPSTDISQMLVIAVPMVVLYVVGIGVAFVFGRERKAEAVS